jgi:6-phosphogluconolactonase
MRRITRRNFLEGAAAALALGMHPWSGFASDSGHEHLLLVGTQTAEPSTSKGIYSYRFNAETGELIQIGLAVEAENPTFLVLGPRERFVYAVNEVRQGTVSGFSFGKKSMRLQEISKVSSNGGGPTHVAVDHTGRCVFAANYGGGSVASFQVNDNGQLSEAVSFFQYSADEEKHERKPHAHRVTVSPDNRFLLVNDLGLDVIHVYRLDASTAKLSPHDPPLWRAKTGYGPRALQFHPNGRLAYCVNELKPTVNVLGWDGERGVLTTLQDIALVPEGYTGNAAPSDIAFDRKMMFAYVASRLDDFTATFAVSPMDGKLTMLDKTSCGGKRPRHLALDPTDRWLLIANQDTDTIAVFARDPNNGRLANEAKTFPLSRPQCLVFV